MHLPGLDATFLRAIETTLAKLESMPEMFARVRGNVRRAVLHRFPYVLFFVIQGPEVVVLACVHERRDPARWPRE
jgi:plasmid stabilization system protein ParE